MNFLFFVAGVCAFIAAGTLCSLGHAWQGIIMVFIGVLYFVAGLDGLGEE